VQHLDRIPAEEMVATFLRAELGSPRFEPTILAILERDGWDRSVIEHPDLTSSADNDYRAQVLSEHRGYGRDQDVFTSVPPDVRWYRGQATRFDLEQVRYIDYDYWTELSGGTRLAIDAAERIRQGIEAFRVGNGAYWYLADALKGGASFPEPILVGADVGGPLVLLEGHVRLTAYFLAPECIPPRLPVIVGYAPGLDRK